MNPWEASVPEWVTAVASLLALVGLAFVWKQLHLQKRQLIRDLENDYLQRYWQIRDNIDAAEPASPTERRWRFAYLRLCEDQIDLHNTPGSITDQTWVHWDDGMRVELRRVAMYGELIGGAHPEELVGVKALYAELIPASMSGPTPTSPHSEAASTA